MNAHISVIGSAHPLIHAGVPLALPYGATIAEIADRFVGGRADGDLIRAGLIATVNGVPVPRDTWSQVRPKPGTELVFRLTAQGGVGRSLALFAVTIASAFAAPFLGPIVGSVFGLSATTAQAVAGAAITIGGTLAVNALIPMRTPKLKNAGGRSIAPLSSVAGARNQAIPWGVVPQILGRHRVSPRKTALDYTERVGQDIYLRSLFCVGYGPLTISDHKIGDTPVDDFEDVDLQVKEGYDTDEPISKFPSQVFEDTLAIQLLESDGWQSRTTRVDCDEILVDVTAPDGVFKYNQKKGKYIDRPVTVNVRYRTASGGSWTDLDDIVFARTKKPKRKGRRVETGGGQYEVQVRKETNEYSGDQKVAETMIWTALRSVTDNPPTAFPFKTALVAMRIRGTDQLAGVIDTYNVIAESRVKAFNGTSWTSNQVSRNPADLFRHVLQGEANPRPRTGSQIDLDCLEAWWQFCEDNDYKCDLVVDSDGSVIDALFDVAATGRATPTFIDGKWGVAFATADDEIVWHFTQRNSWGFSEDRVLRNVPHALRYRFINKNRDYAEDERIVYADGYDEDTSTRFEAAEAPGIVRGNQIWRDGRFQLAQATLRPSVYGLSTDIEGLRVTRGNRVRVSYDVPLWGTAAARVKSVAGQVVTLDERVILTVGESYQVRFRLADGTDLLRTVVNTAIETDTIELEGAGSVPEAGDLCSLGPVGLETVVLRVLGIRHTGDLTFRLDLVDDAPALLDIDGEEVPPYDPGITTPPDPFTLKPVAIVVSERITGTGIAAKPVTDVTVQVPRVGNIKAFEFQAKDIDVGGDWENFAVIPAPGLLASSEELEPGSWQFRARSLFADDTSSGWVESAVTDIAGLNAPPDDVEDLRVDVAGDTTLMAWSVVTNPNLSHYQVRFSTATDGTAKWGAAVPIVAQVTGQTAQVPTQPGTYLVKAVTFQDVESVNAASVITVVDGITGLNVVETLEEHNTSPAFDGTHSQTVESGGLLLIAEQPSPAEGYYTSGTYTFDQSLDLGAAYTCRLKAIIAAAGNAIGDTMSTWTALADVALLDNADPSAWSVTLQYRTTEDDPGGSPTWSSWTDLVIGDARFRGIEFRVLLTGTESVSPAISVLAVEVDMPDRVIAAKDIASSAAGDLTVTFSPAFRELRGLAVSGQDMATGDYFTLSNQDETGFDISFYNAGGSRVVRDFDYLAEGYGKLVT